jgi:hypothetical protein
MKNKTLKNLIALGALAVFVFGANSALAYYESIPMGYNVAPVYPNTTQGYSQNVYSPSYSGNSNSNYYNTSAYPNYNTSSSNSVQYNYLQQPASVQAQVVQPQTQVIYVQQPAAPVVQQVATQPQIIYVDRPATTTTVQTQTQPYTYVQPQVKYIEQPTAVRYVNTGSTQGASVLGASVANTRVVTTTGAKNSGTASNTGQFVNYDANNQNVMLASAYGSYNNGQQVVTPMAYDTNGVTALTVGGSGGFMPTSVFQWIILILIILGIVIIARMISRTFSRDSHGAPVH